MIDREQRTERGEAAIMAVFDNQFYTLTNQVIHNMRRLSTLGERWPSVVLIVVGALMIAFSAAIKIGFFARPYSAGADSTAAPGADARAISVQLGPDIVDSMEFMTLVLSGAGLMLAGALFSLYQARSLRNIVKAQQLIGTEILHKQIDVEKDLLARQQTQQAGQLILLPGKKHKRYRR